MVFNEVLILIRLSDSFQKTQEIYNGNITKDIFQTIQNLIRSFDNLKRSINQNELNKFIKTWNDYVKQGGFINEGLWEIFNVIQVNTNYQLCAILRSDINEYLLRDYSRFVKNFENIIETKGRRFTQLYDEVKIILGEMKPIKRNDKHYKTNGGKGLNNYYIQFNNPDTDEIFYIRNTRNAFNPYGFHNSRFTGKKRITHIIEQNLFEKISISDESNKEFRDIISKQLRKIIPEAGRSVSSCINVFRLKVNAKFVKEALDYLLYRYLKKIDVNSLKGIHSERILNYISQNGLIIKDVITTTRKVNKFSFEIATVNKNNVINSLVTGLIEKLKWKGVIDSTFWDEVKKRISPLKLAKELQRSFL
jgi:hypothetical protein